MNLTNLYSLRESFCVIGLTGRLGAGCSDVSRILETPFTELVEDERIRKKEQLIEISSKQSNSIVSSKALKYRACYDYSKQNWKQFKPIKYQHVIFFLLISELDSSGFTKAISKYCKDQSRKDQLQTVISGFYKTNAKLISQIKALGTVKELITLKESVRNPSSSTLDDLYQAYFESDFENKVSDFIESLNHVDLKSRFWLVHRVSCNLRGHGKCQVKDEKANPETIDFIYTVAEIINRLIKAWKSNNKKTHIIIESLRNSLELMFFKERYSAFYLLSINSSFRKTTLTNRFEEKKSLKNMAPEERQRLVEWVLELDDDEYRTQDFKKGDFSAPDVQNCIQKADIHLNNDWAFAEPSNKEELLDFGSLGEQLMKYTALMQKPGLITPDNTERCMQIAYNAKFNSGCISRQVGAVVSDFNYAIKAVGWNDVPSNQTPCNLRDINDLRGSNPHLKTSFSDFELGNDTTDRNKSKKFNNKLLDSASILNSKKAELKSRVCSFCFKSHYNAFEGEENQVHTRSLHAEENAMLQISKYGGQGLLQGVLYTTASPCELCSKKAFQLGIRVVYYIDPYPGISQGQILGAGNMNNRPTMMLFRGAIGTAFHKLYEPFMAVKDEIKLLTGHSPDMDSKKLFEKVVKSIGPDGKDAFNDIKDDINALSNDEFKNEVIKFMNRMKKVNSGKTNKN